MAHAIKAKCHTVRSSAISENVALSAATPAIASRKKPRWRPHRTGKRDAKYRASSQLCGPAKMNTAPMETATGKTAARNAAPLTNAAASIDGAARRHASAGVTDAVPGPAADQGDGAAPAAASSEE